MYDVVVVGAGPSGCMAAKYAAKRGASTLIIEKNAEVGVPVHCAGLVSSRTLEETELSNIESFISSEIKGAVIHSPNHDMHVEARAGNRAYAIRRDVFDRALAEEAVKSGAGLITNSRVIGMVAGNGGVRIRVRVAGEVREISAKVVIGADGVRSAVAEIAGMNFRKYILSCVQAEGCYGDGDCAEIFVSRAIAPGFFAWLIPLGDGNARFGLCIDKRYSAPGSTPMHYFKKFLHQHSHTSHLSYSGGEIPIAAASLRPHKTVRVMKRTGILLVGDAAAQVKPITGGGLYYGLKCGKIAGEIAAKAAYKDDMHLLYDYERRWREEIWMEIAFGIWVHRLRCMLRDEEFDVIFRLLERERTRIEREGDMDYPSLVLRELIIKPEIFMLVTKGVIKYICGRGLDIKEG